MQIAEYFALAPCVVEVGRHCLISMAPATFHPSRVEGSSSSCNGKNRRS